MPPARSSAPRAPIAPLLHESLGERVYRTVRDLILSQVFPPGSKLNVEQICRDLGVSRTPVWDTMRRLESEGLVNTAPRRLRAQLRGRPDPRSLRGARRAGGPRGPPGRAEPRRRHAGRARGDHEGAGAR